MLDKQAMHDIFGPIMIGLSATMAPSLAHGFIYDTNAVRYGVYTDKQHRFISPSQKDIEQIWDQVRQMGIQPKYLEIIVPDNDAIIIKA